MRFFDITNEGDFLKIRELAPAVAPGTPGAPLGAPPPGAAPTGSAPPPNPQMQQKMMAQQALDRANQKKQIQDQIKQTQEQLADLQKQLAAIK
jgi:hypothetical protein